ncbi:MAG: hypothetical protein MUE98_00505 [Rhodobacteraceae bacterium]|jgi:hypothetical protein|nr:hypothetical protein [Paracoccaceae bacterium]
MTNMPIKLVAFAILLGFLGILIYRVPRLDLGALVALTLVLAAVDLFWKSRRG